MLSQVTLDKRAGIGGEEEEGSQRALWGIGILFLLNALLLFLLHRHARSWLTSTQAGAVQEGGDGGSVEAFSSGGSTAEQLIRVLNISRDECVYGTSERC